MPEAVITFRARYAIWGTHDVAEFRDIAGGRLEDDPEEGLVFRRADGRAEPVEDGTVVYLPAGGTVPSVATPQAWASMTGGSAGST